MEIKKLDEVTLYHPGVGRSVRMRGREAVDIEVVKTVDIEQVETVSVAVMVIVVRRKRNLTLGKVKKANLDQKWQPKHCKIQRRNCRTPSKF